MVIGSSTDMSADHQKALRQKALDRLGRLGKRTETSGAIGSDGKVNLKETEEEVEERKKNSEKTAAAAAKKKNKRALEKTVSAESTASSNFDFLVRGGTRIQTTGTRQRKQKSRLRLQVLSPHPHPKKLPLQHHWARALEDSAAMLSDSVLPTALRP